MLNKSHIAVGWIFCLLPAFVANALALQPDQIALVVNRNAPAGVAIAEYYAKVRHIPDGRIIQLALPVTDEITFEVYERDVVAPVRDYLTAHSLQNTVKCLVSFYGMPLRVGSRTITENDQSELKGVQAEATETFKNIESLVLDVEKLAKDVNPAFKPLVGNDADAVSKRAAAAMSVAAKTLENPQQGYQAGEQARRFAALFRQFSGPAATLKLAIAVNIPGEPSLSAEQLADVRQRLTKAQQDAATFEARRFDPDARARLRVIVRESFGIFSYARLLRAQETYFETAESNAAVDNELALLWWNFYSRAKWQGNPLNHRLSHLHAPPVLMVMRLDGPGEPAVRKLIDTSLAVESTGLKGIVALDSRGIAPRGVDSKEDAYGVYDQSIRNLAELLRTKTKLTLKTDDTSSLLPAHSAKDVALYCGWYSLRHYVPSCDLAPGAVAFHVASLEMVSLHNPAETGWARGLLNDGACATLGPVAEPFLHAFPRADEFFPLLLTGKLTLAECYWKTTPLTSWMITMVGDPLYNPYKATPAIAPADLPDALRKAIDSPAASAP